MSGSEILLIFVAILVLFGADKLPGFARMLGKGLNEIKKATDDIKNELIQSSNEIKNELNQGTNVIHESINEIKNTANDNVQDINKSIENKVIPHQESTPIPTDNTADIYKNTESGFTNVSEAENATLLNQEKKNKENPKPVA